MIKVYGDGASSPSLAAKGELVPGAYVSIAKFPDGRELRVWGGAMGTTNNRMELAAIIAALELIPVGEQIEFIGDSQYALQAYKSKGELNLDLIRRLRKIVDIHGKENVIFTWVRREENKTADSACGKVKAMVVESHAKTGVTKFGPYHKWIIPEKVTEDIFDGGEEVTLIPVNTHGVMGAGLALTFKQKYPKLFEEYRRWCKPELQWHFCRVLSLEQNGRWFMMVPTKTHWKIPSALPMIKAIMPEVIAECQRRGFHSIGFPKLGCGKGGLKWEEVRPIIVEEMSRTTIAYKLYE